MLTIPAILFISLGWIIPLWIGIRHIRDGLRSGISLTAMASFWGLGIIVVIGMVITGDDAIINHKVMIRAAIWLGWIVPVIAGIIYLRRHDKGGYPLAVLGGLWALFGLYLIGAFANQMLTGPPYIAMIEATKQGKGLMLLELKITGHDGRDYKVWHFRDAMNPPTVQALSASGRVIWQAPMQYG